MSKFSGVGFPHQTKIPAGATVSAAINAEKENQPLLSVNRTKDNHSIFENEATAEKARSKRLKPVWSKYDNELNLVGSIFKAAPLPNQTRNTQFQSQTTHTMF